MVKQATAAATRLTVRMVYHLESQDLPCTFLADSELASVLKLSFADIKDCLSIFLVPCKGRSHRACLLLMVMAETMQPPQYMHNMWPYSVMLNTTRQCDSQLSDLWC